MSDISSVESQVQTLLAQAKDAQFSRDYERAEKYLNKSLALIPDSGVVLSQLGKLYVASGKDEKALEVYLKILEIDSDNFAAMDYLGGIYRRLGKYDESVEILKRAFSIHENAISIFYNLGQTYKIMEKFDEARECFEKVLDVNPEDVLAYNHLGCIYAQQGDHKKALQQFRSALKVDENHPILHFNAARSYEALGADEEARAAYEFALRKKPGWIEAMKGYARLLHKCNRNHEAEGVLKQAVNLKDSDAELHSMLGKIYVMLDKLKEASSEFDTALELSDDNVTAMDGKISLLMMDQKIDEAYDILLRMDKLVDTNEVLSLQCAQYLIDMGKYREASEHLRILLNKNPKNPEALCLLGEYFLIKGEETKGCQCFDKGLKIKPEDIYYRFKAARHLYDHGNYESAEVQMRYYLSVRPGDVDGWIHLGIVYTELGDVESAVKVFRKALSLNPSSPALLAAVTRLDKNNHDNPDVAALMQDVLAQHKGDSDDMFDLEQSLEAYEQSLKNMPLDNDVERNLRFLAEDAADEEVDFDDISFEQQYQEIPIEGEDDIPMPETEEMEDTPDDVSAETEDDLLIGDGELKESEEQEEPAAEKSEDDFSLNDDGFDDLREKTLDEDEDFPIDFDEVEENLDSDDDFDSLVLGSGEDVPIDPDYDDPAPAKRANPFDSAPRANDDREIVESEEVFDLAPKRPERPSAPVNPEPMMPPPVPPMMPQYPQYQPYPQYIPVPTMQPPVMPPPVQQMPSVPPRMPESPVYEEPQVVQEPASNVKDDIRAAISAALEKLHQDSVREADQKAEKIAAMFQYMKGLCDYLPQPKKTLFMSSENRMQLEYVINKLKGHPGLLNEASTVKETIQENERLSLNPSELLIKEEKEHEKEKIKPSSGDINNTLLYMRDLTSDMPDKDLATALNSKIRKLLNRCDSEKASI